MKLDIKKGFSLVELMIAMVIGLFLTLGLFTIFRMSSTNVTTTSHFNQLQENGRIALMIMERDISQAGFMGDITSGDMSFSVRQDPNNLLEGINNVLSDCVGGGADNSSYPVSSSFRMIWGYRVGLGADNLACFTADNGPDNDTDVLQIKRLRGRSVNPVLDFNNENRHFVSTNNARAVFYRGGNGRPADLNASFRDWEYAHHVYYIREEGNIPSLRRRELVNNDMDASDGSQSQLVEGIENMRFLYGVDIQGDGEPDVFLPAEDVPDDVWDTQPKVDVPDEVQKVVAIKVFLLVRSIDEDPSYNNDITYQLGPDELGPFNDRYRRKIVSTTIALDNFITIE